MNKNSAFSLVELSIVILIIGILIVGVTQSSRLIRQIKLAMAQSLTRSSDINTISNLTFLAENTLDNSFINSTGSSQIEDGNPISSWIDSKINNSLKIKLTQANIVNQPIYTSDGINGLPSLVFNGTNQSLFITNSMPLGLANKNYSLVLVWRANIVSSVQARMMIGQGTYPMDYHRLGSITLFNS